MNNKSNSKIFWKILLIILFVIISVLNFVRIDSVSHSASDTLRPFILQTAAIALIFFLIYRITNKKVKDS